MKVIIDKCNKKSGALCDCNAIHDACNGICYPDFAKITTQVKKSKK